MPGEMEPGETQKATEEFSLPSQLETLAKLIEEKPEALATGSEGLRRAALDATKFVYDLALHTEKDACGRVNELLASISPNHAPQTRSQAAKGSRKRKRGSLSPVPLEKAIPLLKETPLAHLIIEGMSDEQIWAELELRAQNVCDILNYALDGPTPGADIGESSDESGDEEEEERELKKMRQALIDEGFDPAELEDMGFDDDDEEEEEDSEEEDDALEEESEEDEDGGVELGEGVEGLRDPSDEDEDGDEDRDDFGAGELSSLSGSKRILKFKLKRGGHPVLDDGFFDLAAFNAEIEAAESKSVSQGRLSKDDEEDDDEDVESVDLFAPIDDTAAFDEEDIEQGGEFFYKDFFEPPSKVKGPKAKKFAKGVDDDPPASAGRVRFHEEVKVRKIKAKGKNLPISTMFYEEDDEDDDYEYEDEEGAGFDDDDDDDDADDIEEDEEEGMLSQGSDDDEESEDGDGKSDLNVLESDESGLATMERFKDDLFADDDEEPREQQGMSTHEKRVSTLREEIAALEAENVGDKDWTLMGEASSRSRPQNSLLEEDLEFERVMKSVPVITEEIVHSLEERIKTRILENQFDDVVRKRPVDDKPFLPSRFFELQDTKSKQSLADIYEDEYTAAQSGGIAGEDRDGKLKKEHQDIEKLWENICSKLDALCNAHFTPKAPKATITSVSNVAAATLESALPTAKATSAMLAPEEIYAHASRELRAQSELTPAEKRALRNKHKKSNKKAREALEKSVQKFGRPKGVGDVKRQKEAALTTLVKSGKGVIVVGKKSKEVEGKRSRGKT